MASLEDSVRAWLRGLAQKPHVIDRVVALARSARLLLSYRWGIRAMPVAQLNVQGRCGQILVRVRRMERVQCNVCAWIGWGDERGSVDWGEDYDEVICPQCGDWEEDYSVHGCDYTG